MGVLGFLGHVTPGQGPSSLLLSILRLLCNLSQILEASRLPTLGRRLLLHFSGDSSTDFKDHVLSQLVLHPGAIPESILNKASPGRGSGEVCSIDHMWPPGSNNFLFYAILLLSYYKHGRTFPINTA